MSTTNISYTTLINFFFFVRILSFLPFYNAENMLNFSLNSISFKKVYLLHPACSNMCTLFFRAQLAIFVIDWRLYLNSNKQKAA